MGASRGQLTHDATSPIDYLDRVAAYTLAGHAGQITCPTRVCNADGDEVGATAPQLFYALTCPEQFTRFAVDEGAGDHCEQAARTLYHARSFGWLDQHLVVPALSDA